MKAIKRVTLIMLGISGVYLAVSAALTFTELSFRAWVDMLGQMIAGILTPIMVLALALAHLYGNERVHQAVKAVCITAAVIVCGIYICLAMFFVLLGSQEERMLTGHLLVTDESFLSETKPVYYRPTAFFFKKPGELTVEDGAEYLEKRYKRPFAVYGSGTGIYDVGFPEITVSVKPEGMTLADNYVEELTLYRLLEAYRALEIEREYTIVKPGGGWRQYLCLEVSGYDDIPAAAEDISRMTAYVLSGEMPESVADIYREYMGHIYFSFGGGERDCRGAVGIGGKSKEEPIDVEGIVRSAYRKYGGGQSEEAGDSENDGQEAQDQMGSAAAEDDSGETEPESDYREEAARIVYDAVLAEEGFSYEVYYNAKGNLYIDLGSQTWDGDGRVYSYRLVYDRPSKNGACELFVLYRSAEGSDNEAIVDMYAVETATGKVAASGRKAWSDVGTKEYREMTGE